ncbi:hypothetical protein SAMN04488112_105139 [Melghirimyces thermohalophilus]|uniref:GAF domain-containing protein n=1 Tax=Melghirimyces thermohalophilus TaxID=1236220 RepID=A0A1G6K9S9_9BACL|nr:hypothetical protein [Melghirimyces thermohalophilus]SDC27703.1 hypothetical protein SAMN04488112_105139 [Melghirimyces thermohalophilus]
MTESITRFYERYPKAAPFALALTLTLTGSPVGLIGLKYQVASWMLLVLGVLIAVLGWFFHQQMVKSVTTRETIDHSNTIVDALEYIAVITTKSMCRAAEDPSQTVQEGRLEIRSTFDRILSSIRLGIERTNPSSVGEEAGRTSKDPRVVLFIPDDLDKPRVLTPFSHAGHKNIEEMPLPEIDDKSDFTAVKAWLDRVDLFIDDVWKKGEPWEKPSKRLKRKEEYRSIAAVLIQVGHQPLGVLSVTGKEKNAYHREVDQERIRLFAQAIAPLLYFYHGVLPKLESRKAGR